MKEWSPRPEVKASRVPSGDHRGSLEVPLAKNNRLAGADPSILTVLTCPPVRNATTSLRGERTGSSPSARSFGAAPPAKGTDQIWTLGGVGSEAGFGARSVQLAPWSPPRTYTTQFPSREIVTEVSSWPSSVR